MAEAEAAVHLNEIVQALIHQAPAFAALVLLVVLFGIFLWRLFIKIMDFQTGIMGEIRKLSETCHASHREVSQDTASAVERCTEAIDKLSDGQKNTEIALKGVTTLLERVNGRLSR